MPSDRQISVKLLGVIIHNKRKNIDITTLLYI
jgi:hypothetical protein